MKVFFTIITKSYLAQARVLEACLSEFHPNIKFLVVLVDNPNGYFDPSKEKFEIIQLSEILDPDWWPEVTGYYTAYELCNAAKPFVHEFLLTKKKFETTIYLDSDIFVLGSLQCVFDEIKEHSFLITPHLIKPDIQFTQEKIELGAIWSGIFNGGFVAINHCSESLSFLDWWKKRLYWNCTHQYGFREVDQSWLSFAPVYYGNCKISKNPALNIAYWNFHERNISLSNDNQVMAGDQKAVLLHLSGWQFDNPEKLTKHDIFHHCMTHSESVAWEFMWTSYSNLLNKYGITICRTYPYCYEVSNDGAVITSMMRKKYLNNLKENTVNRKKVVSIFELPSNYSVKETPYCHVSLRSELRNKLAGAKRKIKNKIFTIFKHKILLDIFLYLRGKYSSNDLEILKEILKKYDINSLNELFLGKNVIFIKNILPGHFYSPIPDMDYVEPHRDEIFSPKRQVLNLNMNEQGQRDFFLKVSSHYSGMPFTSEKQTGLRYFFNNPFFSYGDGVALYGILREVPVKRVVEVGSGFSSALMLDVNEKFLNIRIDFTFIEPFPDRFQELVGRSPSKHRLLVKSVHDVDLDVFSSLERDDILFIDSSHVGKIGSDFLHILFNVLPILQSGVLIHFHDIFWPFEYPESWVKEGRAWNEIYFLRAFLAHNPDYEIVFFNSFFVEKNRELVAKLAPLMLEKTDFPENYPNSSLWLRKK